MSNPCRTVVQQQSQPKRLVSANVRTKAKVAVKASIKTMSRAIHASGVMPRHNELKQSAKRVSAVKESSTVSQRSMAKQPSMPKNSLALKQPHAPRKTSAPKRALLGNSQARATNVVIAGLEPTAKHVRIPTEVKQKVKQSSDTKQSSAAEKAFTAKQAFPVKTSSTAKNVLSGNSKAVSRNGFVAGVRPSTLRTELSHKHVLRQSRDARPSQSYHTGLNPAAHITINNTEHGWEIVETEVKTIRVTSTGTYVQDKAKDFVVVRKNSHGRVHVPAAPRIKEPLIKKDYARELIRGTSSRELHALRQSRLPSYKVPTQNKAPQTVGKSIIRQEPGAPRKSVPAARMPQSFKRDARRQLRKSGSNENLRTLLHASASLAKPIVQQSPSSEGSTIVGSTATIIPKRKISKSPSSDDLRALRRAAAPEGDVTVESTSDSEAETVTAPTPAKIPKRKLRKSASSEELRALHRAAAPAATPTRKSPPESLSETGTIVSLLSGNFVLRQKCPFRRASVFGLFPDVNN